MIEEVDKTKQDENSEESTQAQPSRFAGLIKYALYGVAGLVVVAGIAYGTLMLVGSDSASKTPAEKQVKSAKSGDAAAESHGNSGDNTEVATEPMSAEDSILAMLEQDESVLDAIMANLEVLDYVPGEAELTEEQAGMTVEDSIEAVNWLIAEKSKLAEREKELDAREKKLNVLDSKVSQKITRLEQAESTRVSKLARLYDGMEARAVAKLIANLDDATVVALLPRMKLKNASAVLSLMPPARGARLSKQMITIAEN